MAVLISVSILVGVATIFSLSCNAVRSQSCGPDEEIKCFSEFIDAASQVFGITAQQAIKIRHSLWELDQSNPYLNRDEICRMESQVDMAKFAKCMGAYEETCGPATGAPSDGGTPNQGQKETNCTCTWEMKTKPLVDICDPGCDDGEELTSNALRTCMSGTEQKMAQGGRPKCSEVQRDFDCATLMVKKCPYAFNAFIHYSIPVLAQAAGPDCKLQASHLLGNITVTDAFNSSQKPGSRLLDFAYVFFLTLTSMMGMKSVYN